MLNLNIMASFANDNDALIPELWARESIAVLEENMVMGNLIHRDFSSEIAQYGDVVNTRKPADMQVARKTDADTVDYNDAKLNNVAVKLDQHLYTAFIIKDGERSQSMQDLLGIHLMPAMKAMGNGIDRAILGRMAHELIGTPAARVGQLTKLDSSNAKNTVLAARERMNRTLAHTGGRNLVLAPGSETAILSDALFLAADQRGDGGAALTSAHLGRILGFDTYMDQNVNGIVAATASTEVTADASVAGDADVAVTASAAVAGQFINFAGNDQPTWVTANDATDVTLNESLKYNVASGADVTLFPAGTTTATEYSAGYSKGVTLVGIAPSVGHLVAFGTSAGARHTYTVISVQANGDVLLDRPLDKTVTASSAAFVGPNGDFNLAFNRDAFALISRPLAQPEASMGARSFVASYNNIAMRATMQYDIDAQGTKVVLDMLAGTAMLDANLATLVLG